MKKQTAVQIIFEKFNLMSDADFKSWMLNNHDELELMEKEQIMSSYSSGISAHPYDFTSGDRYYNKTYGGDK